MNEQQRQAYLSALGIETYMPRWCLSLAPNSIACIWPLVHEYERPAGELARNEEIIIGEHASLKKEVMPEANLLPASSISTLLDISNDNKPKHSITSASDILTQLDTNRATINPFSLSIWRPLSDLLIVDSRNSSLALPTELLLNNMLRYMFAEQTLDLNEDVLRWPMIENSFVKRTAQDARIELQTWLSVQQEIRPFSHLWLMGENAIRHFSSESIEFKEHLFKPVTIGESNFKALCLPSLNELLLRPNEKRNAFFALHHYHQNNK